MPGQGGLDSYFSGLLVANFTNQNDVRVLAHNRSETACKSQVDFGINLNLADAFDLIFNGVFDGNNIDIRPIDRR